MRTGIDIAYALCKARLQIGSIEGVSVNSRQSSLASDVVRDW